MQMQIKLFPGTGRKPVVADVKQKTLKQVAKQRILFSIVEYSQSWKICDLLMHAT